MPDTPQFEDTSDHASDKPAVGSHDVSDEIAAEIQDHLASAAETLARQGADEQQARQAAAQRFGNPAQIQRRCWWIQQGDQVMFRVITITLLAVLCLGLAAMGFGNWHLNSRLEQLTVALTDLSKQQSQASDRAAKHLPEISGHCYLSDRARPAIGKEVELLQFPEMKVLRKMRTDQQGQFHFGVLPAGDYCLTTALSGAKNPIMNGIPLYWIQSQPLYVTEGAILPSVELDVYFASGRVLVELKTKPPGRVEVGNRVIAVGFNFTLAHDLIKLPWRPSDPLPRKWPGIGFTLEGFRIGVPMGAENAGKGPKAVDVPLPAGQYRFAARIGDTLMGAAGMGGMMGGQGGGFFIFPNADDSPTLDLLNKPATGQARAPANEAAAKVKYWPDVPTSARTDVDIGDGETVRLEIQLPDDAADRLRQAIMARDAKVAENDETAASEYEPAAVVNGQISKTLSREK